MTNYENILTWYRMGIWQKSQVRAAVKLGKITPEQYKTITGEDYERHQ